MAIDEATRVGFTFLHGGPEWHGGLNYFRSLFQALQALPRATIEPVALLGRQADAASYGFPPNVRVVRDAVLDRRSPRWFANRLAARLFGVPVVSNRALLREGVRVLSHAAPSRSAALKSIGWIPDFQHLHLPQFFSPSELRNRDRLYRGWLRDCDRLVVSSESARKDLETFAPAFAHKARVLRFCAVPRAAGDAARLDIDVASIYGGDAPYFYLPNQVWAHKNHLTVIRALAQVANDHPDVKVLCSGGLTDYRNPQHMPGLRGEIARLGLEERFVFLGLVPYGHIAPLMLRAVAVVNPSLFEGWSTTVEEAKSLGVPLVLSGLDVHREQCPDGQAAFFDPLDAAQLAERLRAALSAWDGAPRDPRPAIEAYRGRVIDFALGFEAIVAELAPRAPPAAA